MLTWEDNKQNCRYRSDDVFREWYTWNWKIIVWDEIYGNKLKIPSYTKLIQSTLFGSLLRNGWMSIKIIVGGHLGNKMI